MAALGPWSEELKRYLEVDKDYYLNAQGLLVMTASYLRERGYCCANGCKHCPYTREEFMVARQKRRRASLLGD